MTRESHDNHPRITRVWIVNGLWRKRKNIKQTCKKTRKISKIFAYIIFFL